MNIGGVNGPVEHAFERFGGREERELAESQERFARRFAFSIALVALHFDSSAYGKESNEAPVVVFAHFDESRIGKDSQRGVDRTISDSVDL